MITIVDYGMGNLGSIRNMLKKLGAECEVTGDPGRVERATKLILPGVGAFDAGMSRLAAAGLVPVLDELVVRRKVPTLGICLGMQLMTEDSEEGRLRGLAWVRARTVRIPSPPGSGLKVPHMGWNVVQPCKDSELLAGAEEEERFYFVHSFYVHCEDPRDVLLRTSYGIGMDAGFESGNVMGVQFHPEKSHKYGLRLLSNFARAYQCCEPA